MWRNVKITQLFIGSNSVVQEAGVKIEERRKRAVIISRPIQKLYPIEVKDMNMPFSNQRSKTNKDKTNEESELVK